MVRSGRSHSKEDVRSINTDSGISLSSPPEIKRCLDDYDDDDELDEKIFINGDEEPSCKTSPLSRKKFKQFYTCNVCKKEFRGKTDLNRHMLIHSGERPHKCEQCGKSFRQAVNLKNHITIVHVGKKQFACTECSKSFALKERLRLHMRIHSGEKPYVCNECNKKFARGGQLTQHLLTNHDSSSKKFVCSKCSAGFLTAGNLKAHLKRHEEGFDTFCDKCAVHFPNNMLLQAHINKTHNQLEEQYCEICEKYIKFEQFAAHLKSHSSSKFHVCEVCNSCFTQKSQYNVHLRMHTGERPYQCRICLQTFAHSSVLKLHIRKHTGEKPFSCILCKDGVAFSQLAHLKTHMKKVHNQHNSYMCEGCNEFFKTKAHLLEHTEKSSGCKPVGIERQNSENTEAQQLSNLRLLIAILLKKISPEEKLKQLGYEKRLIDNVVIASLKVANRKTYDDTKLSAIERMRLNIEEFLNWIVPDQVMNQFRSEKLLVDTILDKIVTIYLKQK